MQRPGRVLGVPSARAACGGNLSLTCLLLRVMPQTAVRVELAGRTEYYANRAERELRASLLAL
jgi:hypothetical protein